MPIRLSPLSTGLGVLVTLASIVAPLSPLVLAGCGSSDSNGGAPGITVDGGGTADASTPSTTTVVTGGGGEDAGSTPGMPGDPFASPDAGLAGDIDGATSEAGFVDGGALADGSGLSDATASSDTGVPPVDAGPAHPGLTCPDKPPPLLCGTSDNASCDLQSSTCCTTAKQKPVAHCVAGTGSGPQTVCDIMNEVGIHCRDACDCGAGLSCCARANIGAAVETTCDAVPDGGFCSPHPSTVSQVSAQLCAQSGECKDGSACIKQTCALGAVLSLCGLYDKAPFLCKATP